MIAPLPQRFGWYIAAGEATCIVDPSGSSKSTVAKPVQPLFVLEHRQVLVDGLGFGIVRQHLALADPAMSFDRVGGSNGSPLPAMWCCSWMAARSSSRGRRQRMSARGTFLARSWNADRRSSLGPSSNMLEEGLAHQGDGHFKKISH
jgi:hypothetical protein